MVRMKVDRHSPRSFGDSWSNLPCRIQEELPSDVICGEDSKRGICFSELQRTNMGQLIASPGTIDGKENSSCIIQKVEDGEAVTPESLASQETRKRMCPFEEVKTAKCGPRSRKRSENSIVRWSTERYKQAEGSLFNILKEQGAVFDKRMTRHQLKEAALKCFGDTGLLDHLLKHLDRKVAPNGTERLIRAHNPEGVIEYWLESADLDQTRRETGVQNRFWVPPSCVKLENSTLEEPASSADLKLLQDEMTNMKRLLEEVGSKKRGQDGEANSVKNWQNEFIRWTTKTSQSLTEISSSLAGMQDMYRDLIAWKDKTEEQLAGLLSSLNNMQQCTQPSGPAEKWEDWLDSTALDSIHGEDFSNWLLSEPIFNAGKDIILYDPSSSLPGKSEPENVPSDKPDCVKEVLMLKEELAKLKSEMKELEPKKQEQSFANWLIGGSFDADPILGINKWQALQEMLELLKWKPKMEQQLIELSNAVRHRGS